MPAPVQPVPEETPPKSDPQPEPHRVRRFEEVMLPTSSVIGLQVETSLSSERARVEDRVEARVTRDVMAGGTRGDSRRLARDRHRSRWSIAAAR